MHPPLITALLDPARYPHPADAVDLVETHISWVLLAGEFAYKIKKPVALGFLDFSTLEARKRSCDEELRLNRRTAPGLYLDVVAITGSTAAPVPGGDGPAIEYAVRMHRFAQDALLDHLARHGALDAAIIDRLAATIAGFHATAAVAAPDSPFGSPASVTAPALENFDQIAQLQPPEVDATRLEHLRQWTAAESTRLQTTFASRKAQGFVRECHGDLHVGNVVLLEATPVLFDGIEFNAGLRWTDVMNDIAFLVMDLLDHGLDMLAWRVLDRYLQHGGDYEGVAVMRYYMVYRATVRAKVALIRARQDAGAAGGDAEDAFRRHLWLAERLAKPGPAALVLMHGVSGTGKSWCAQALLESTGALRVRSDVERKRLHGLAADASSASAVGAGLYGAEATQRTYARLESVAALALRAGWTLIADAAFLHRAERDRFRSLAVALAAPFAVVSCQAPVQVLRQRLAERARSATDPSEAGAAVLEHQLASQEHLGADELARTILVRTTEADPRDLALRLCALLDGTGSAEA